MYAVMKKLYLCIILIFLLTSCGLIPGNPASPEDPPATQSEAPSNQTQSPPAGQGPADAPGAETDGDAAQTPEPPDTDPEETDPSGNDPDGADSENDLRFSDLADMVFWFGSGVGAWHTEVTIASDGTFSGVHGDTDMGDTGEDYPNGTFYICNFSGAFTPLVKVSDFEYTMSILSLTQYGTPGDESIEEDGIRYIISTPYGFDNANEFVMYLPGRTADGLPEEFLQWVCAPRGIDYHEITVLNFWGLYNIGGEQGFSCEGRQYDTLDYNSEWPLDLPYDMPAYNDGDIADVYIDSFGNICINILNTSRSAFEEYIELMVLAGWDNALEDAPDDTPEDALEDADDPWACSFVKEDGDAIQNVSVTIDYDEETVSIIIW